jgi:uncharacterized protein
MKTTLETHSAPWWRFPIMWLVVGGPLAVVLASFVTAWLAIDGADASLATAPRAHDVAQGGVRARSQAPAQQARNHAATPVEPAAPAAATPSSAPTNQP